MLAIVCDAEIGVHNLIFARVPAIRFVARYIDINDATRDLIRQLEHTPGFRWPSVHHLRNVKLSQVKTRIAYWTVLEVWRSSNGMFALDTPPNNPPQQAGPASHLHGHAGSAQAVAGVHPLPPGNTTTFQVTLQQAVPAGQLLGYPGLAQARTNGSGLTVAVVHPLAQMTLQQAGPAVQSLDHRDRPGLTQASTNSVAQVSADVSPLVPRSTMTTPTTAEQAGPASQSLGHLGSSQPVAMRSRVGTRSRVAANTSMEPNPPEQATPQTTEDEGWSRYGPSRITQLATSMVSTTTSKISTGSTGSEAKLAAKRKQANTNRHQTGRRAVAESDDEDDESEAEPVPKHKSRKASTHTTTTLEDRLLHLLIILPYATGGMIKWPLSDIILAIDAKKKVLLSLTRLNICPLYYQLCQKLGIAMPGGSQGIQNLDNFCQKLTLTSKWHFPLLYTRAIYLNPT